MNVSDFMYVANKYFYGFSEITKHANAFISDERVEVLNELIGDDERGFYIVEHNSKYVLYDSERTKIVKYYENDPEMVQVYEDVITYMEKSINKKYS